MRWHATRPAEKHEDDASAVRHQPMAEGPGLDPAGLVPSLLTLQRTHGNRLVQRLLTQGTSPRLEPAADVEQAIEQARGGGQPLDRTAQRQMESAFGVDFSSVRVHVDSEADSLNRAVEARAFTTGSDIFFSGGAYEPGSSAGRHLLAHELTHVVQQNAGTVSRGVQAKMTVSHPLDAEEAEADAIATEVTATIDAASAHANVDRAAAAPLPLTGLQRQAIQRDAAPDTTHEVEVWIDYNNTLKKAGGKPEARTPNSALYVDDIRMVPNKKGTDPKGFHFSGIDVASSGGAKLGVIQHPETDGLVSGVIRFGTTPAVKLDADISYLEDPYDEDPMSDEKKKALEPKMKDAKKNAAKVAQKALSKLGDADDSAIKHDLEDELRAAYPGLDFTVTSLVPQGTSEAFTLPSIPYDPVLSDTLMKLWVNVPATGFTHRYGSETTDRAEVSTETGEAKTVTDISKGGGTSSISTTTIDKVITSIETELKTQIWTNREHLKTTNDTVVWKASAGMKEELKGSIGASGDATVDVGKLIPISKIPLIGKAAGKLGLIPSLPITLKLKADGSADFTSHQDVSRESFSQETNSFKDQTITDWQADIKTKMTKESYSELKTTITSFWEAYHKEEVSTSKKDAAAVEKTKRTRADSVAVTYKAGQPYLTVDGPDTQEPKIIP
jgi:hypothetical protein